MPLSPETLARAAASQPLDHLPLPDQQGSLDHSRSNPLVAYGEGLLAVTPLAEPVPRGQYASPHAFELRRIAWRNRKLVVEQVLPLGGEPKVCSVVTAVDGARVLCFLQLATRQGSRFDAVELRVFETGAGGELRQALAHRFDFHVASLRVCTRGGDCFVKAFDDVHAFQVGPKGVVPRGQVRYAAPRDSGLTLEDIGLAGDRLMLYGARLGDEETPSRGHLVLYDCADPGALRLLGEKELHQLGTLHADLTEGGLALVYFDRLTVLDVSEPAKARKLGAEKVWSTKRQGQWLRVGVHLYACRVQKEVRVVQLRPKVELLPAARLPVAADALLALEDALLVLDGKQGLYALPL